MLYWAHFENASDVVHDFGPVYNNVSHFWYRAMICTYSLQMVNMWWCEKHVTWVHVMFRVLGSSSWVPHVCTYMWIHDQVTLIIGSSFIYNQIRYLRCSFLEYFVTKWSHTSLLVWGRWKAILFSCMDILLYSVWKKGKGGLP